MHSDTREAPHWLWTAVVLGLLGLVLTTAAVLIALALGWNDPRPSGPPHWSAPDLPRTLTAPVASSAVELSSFPTLGPLTPGTRLVLEGIATPISGPTFNGYGFVFFAQNEVDYSVFALGSDGYYAILRIRGEEETELVTWQQFPHIHRGHGSNRLRIECWDAVCAFYINDEYATTVKEVSWSGGDIGLWVRSFEGQAAAARFSSLGVWLEYGDSGSG